MDVASTKRTRIDAFGMTDTQPNVRLVANADEAGVVAASLLSEFAHQSVLARGRFTLAMPGGSSPKSVFAHLSASATSPDFPWRQTQLLWVDERAVPPDHADSNYGGFVRDVLPNLPIDPADVHPMRGELGPDEGAAHYQNLLINVLGTHPIDAVLLGIGEDGHIASLFPGAPSLEAIETVIGIHDSPKPPPMRITLTLPTLRAARLIVILGLGSNKKDAVTRSLSGDPLPARLAASGSSAVWIVDEHAMPVR